MGFDETGRSTRESRRGLPEIRKTVKILTPAQIATLFTLPVVIVPAPGVGLIAYPTFLHVTKQAGTAWTVGTPGQLALGWTGGGGSHSFAQFNQATTQAFFQAITLQYWLGEAGKGSSNSFGDVSANIIDNQAVMLHLTTADISGGTGNLIVSVWHRLWPTAF